MVLKRIRDLVMATVNEGLDRMEDPVIMINQYLRDMEEELNKSRQSCLRQKTLEQSFKNQQNDALKMSEKRLKQAGLAMDAGHEELAKKALIEKRHYDERVTYYSDLAEKAEKQVRDMMEHLDQLHEKYQELRDRKVSLVARANAAKTKTRIQTALHQSEHPATLRGFERLEGKIIEMELKASGLAAFPFEKKREALIDLEGDDEIEQALKEMREARKPHLEKQADSSNEAVL